MSAIAPIKMNANRMVWRCGYGCGWLVLVDVQQAKAMKGKAVFTKVDVNVARDISGAQQIRSMPTFQFYMGGKKRHQFAGGDPNSLDTWAKNLAAEVRSRTKPHSLFCLAHHPLSIAVVLRKQQERHIHGHHSCIYTACQGFVQLYAVFKGDGRTL